MSGVKGKGRRKEDPFVRLKRDVGLASEGLSSDACWLWLKSCDADGYGKCYMAEFGGITRAHRAVYQHFVGPIGDGQIVMHCCDQPSCVNPAHLMLGSAADNNADCNRKGRRPSCSGEANGQTKLTMAAIKVIRSTDLSVRGNRAALARRFGVSPSAITLVLNGRNWKGAM